MLKRSVKGSITVEASYIVPLFLGIFALTVTLLFYYHDKCVVAAVAQEAVTIHGTEQELEEEELRQYFQKRIKGKLLIFSRVQADVEVTEKKISICCKAKKQRLKLQVQMGTLRTTPGKTIRQWRRLE